MYSQNNETGVLEILKIKFFFVAQPWWILQFSTENKVSKRSLNPYHYQVFSKSPRGNTKLQKEQ